MFIEKWSSWQIEYSEVLQSLVHQNNDLTYQGKCLSPFEVQLHSCKKNLCKGRTYRRQILSSHYSCSCQNDYCIHML